MSEKNDKYARIVATIGCGLTIAIGALMACAVFGYQVLREFVATI
ncbi:hypothetical protein [Blastopirellula sediminis]|nr:hypothetical protein [Blastopirellula sediminis]